MNILIFDTCRFLSSQVFLSWVVDVQFPSRYALQLQCLFLVVCLLGAVGRHGINPVHCQINPWTGVVLSAVDEPLEDGDNDDDGERGNTVVWVRLARYSILGLDQPWELTHAASSHSSRRREDEKHCCKNNICQRDLHELAPACNDRVN